MRVFGCAWKINFPEVIFSWPCVLVGLTRKLDSVQIFTSNHFRTHAQREKSPNHSSDRAPVQQPTLHRSRQSQHRADRTRSHRSHHTAPHQRRPTPAPIHTSADQAKIDSNATWSRLYRAISPSHPPYNLASRSNPVASLSSFFSWFDRIWWIFFLDFVSFVFLYWGMILYICLTAEKMWTISRKCIFLWYFQEYNQTP